MKRRLMCGLLDLSRAQNGLTTGEGKLRAVNFLMPYVQRIPDRHPALGMGYAIAQQLRIEEPCFANRCARPQTSAAVR